MNRSTQLGLMAVLALASVSTSASVSYVDWTSATAGTAGSAAGTITLPDASTVGVAYSGDVAFAFTDGTGFNYWSYSSPAPYNNAAYNAYTGVPNMPASSDIVALRRATAPTAPKNTLTFSTPVQDPIMLILSQGQPSLPVDYDFDQDFSILSSGRGYWGGNSAGSLFEQPGDVLHGVEGHGAIQFHGLVSSISWSVNPAENWHGFTVGLTQPTTALPDGGATLALLGVGLGTIGWLRRRTH